MFKVTSRWPHQASIKIEWNLGKRCNYNCEYCPAEIHDNDSPHTDIDVLLKTIDILAKLGSPIRLSFTGGEPCVHPKFEEVVKYAKHKGIKWVSVTTNGTRPFEFYKAISKYVDQFVFSVHFEYEWGRVIDTLVKMSQVSSVALLAQIMAHHNFIPQVKMAREILQHEGIPSTVRRIRWTEGDHDLFDDMRYHPSDLNWIKEQGATILGNCVIDSGELGEQILHANDVIKLHLNKFKGWTCNAGIESLMINWNGDVYRATCRVGGGLGNIYNGTFEVPAAPIVCSRDWCTCASDIPITKINSSGRTQNPA